MNKDEMRQGLPDKVRQGILTPTEAMLVLRVLLAETWENYERRTE